ncbi:MAG: GHKL domain-containing protein [Candidatus Omnitrophica bacterium]|nr:GHKL domain-containing protein [Candidatus Omnitrophota bacterium]
MNLYGISSILTGVTSLSMAVFVYIKGYRNRLARLWSLFAVSAAFYGFGAAMVSYAKDAAKAFFWWQIAYIGIILLPFLFVCLVYEFLGIQHRFFIRLAAFLTLLYLASNFFFKKLFINSCTLYFTEMKWVTPVYFIYPPGPLLIFFIIFTFFGWVIYGHWELLKHYKEITGLKRNQLKYFFIAAALGFAGGGASFLPCFGISFYPIFNFAVPLYFLMMSYAILRYRLLDIRVAITRTGIFVAVYTLVLGAPFLITNWFKGRLVEVFDASWWMIPLGLMATLGTLGPFIYIFLERQAERRLFYEQRRYQETLRQSAREMARIHSLKKLLSLIVHTVTKTVRITHSAIYLFDAKSEQFLLDAGRNLKKGQVTSLTRENPLVFWFETNREPLVYEEIKRKAQENSKIIFTGLEEQMRFLNAAVIVPGFLDRRLIGILVLGDKRFDKVYSSEDLNTFSLLANQAALAIENALLYENMEEQVKKRTEELVTVQKQLIQAEKMATVGTLAGGVAHEINNPLTAILTNVQMLLDSGAIDDKLDKESLELIEQATKRCRTIVRKLMTYAKKPLENAEISAVNLMDMLKSVDSFVGYQLAQDNIKIVIDAPDGDYSVMGNQNELEQVITNIVLNARDAIRQVKNSGDITVSLAKNSEWIKIKIKDEGAGIPKEIMPKIFDPFFTTKDVGRGVGLGLPICQSIVEKHHGSISAQSELNKGSVFTIQLPVKE